MKKKNTFYYNVKNPFCDCMELDKQGYPVYSDTKIRVHRHMAEKYLLKGERKLERGEEVHHVDGNKLNYNPNNLIVLSKEDHWKISKRLQKEVNLNKAHAIVIIIAFGLVIYNNNPNWNVVNRTTIFVLILGMFIPVYSNITDGFMRKTKLYKFIDHDPD